MKPKKSPILEIPEEDQAIIKQIVEVFRNAKKGQDPMKEMADMQHTTAHMLAQQVAFFTVRQPTYDLRQRLVQLTLNKLTVLIRYYEAEIKKAPRGKKKPLALEDKRE